LVQASSSPPATQRQCHTQTPRHTPCRPQITCGKDLALYTEALRQNRQLLPANTLSYPHPPLVFPEALPPELVVEPWVGGPAGGLLLARGLLAALAGRPPAGSSAAAAPVGPAAHGEQQPSTAPPPAQVATPDLMQREGEWQVEQWPDESLPYVEASIGLLGNTGSVEPLGLSLVARWAAAAAGAAAGAPAGTSARDSRCSCCPQSPLPDRRALLPHPAGAPPARWTGSTSPQRPRT
jgi:hypothetical protein